MKNLGPSIAKTAGTQQQFTKSTDEPLALPPGNKAQTIYVKAVDQEAGQIAGFSLQEDGPYYTEGLSCHIEDGPWAITFLFGDGIAGISCAPLNFAANVSGKPAMTIPAHEAAYDGLKVALSAGGATTNAKIWVTPP